MKGRCLNRCPYCGEEDVYLTAHLPCETQEGVEA